MTDRRPENDAMPQLDFVQNERSFRDIVPRNVRVCS